MDLTSVRAASAIRPVGFRRDIEGLRAASILAVVLYTRARVSGGQKLLKAEPRESTEAAEQESEYPADETNEG